MKKDILRLRKEGKTYNEIVAELGCSKSTINYHCGVNGKEFTHKRGLILRRKYRKYQKDFINRVKTIKGCRDCGNKDFRVLDFDHVRGEKSFNISRAQRYYFKLEKVKMEMRKCEIRCSNCHRIKTYNETHT